MATWTIGGVSVTRVEEQLGFASFPPEQYLAGSSASCYSGTWAGWCRITTRRSTTV